MLLIRKIYLLLEMDIISLFLTSVLISFLLVHLVQKYRHTRKISKAIECFGGPRYIPIVGTNLSLLRAGPTEIWRAYLQRNAEYGPLFRSWMGNIPCIHLMKPQHIEVVLNSTENVEKGVNYHFLKPWFGNGLLTSERSIWRKHRKLLTPAFHFSILDNFSEIFTRKSQMLADQLLPKADGKFFDVYPYLTHCALDIICETAMGVKINAMDNSNSEYVNAVYGVLTKMTERMVNPFYHSDFIYFLTNKGREHQKYLKILHEFTEQVIREKQEKRNNMKQCLTQEDKLLGKKERVAFLDLLLGIKDLSFVDIRHEVDTFMFGGHDSSTVTSCWTIFLLGNHPDIQDEVHNELNEIFQGDERPVTANDLNQMKYLERVIKETLRLYTVAPSIGRTLTKEIVIDEHVVPPGVLAFLHLHDLHHDPENFPNPDKFDPDRFLPENTKGRHPFAYIPFSAGPRNCIGQKYGMRSVKTLLATFFRRYKVTSMKKPEEMDCLFTIFLRPQGGMHIALEVRNNNSQ